MNVKYIRVFVENVAARFSQSVMNIIIGFVMMPFFFKHLGAADYSLWILIGSITSAYYIMDLGISSVLARALVKELRGQDATSANFYINSALVIYLGLAILIGTIILALSIYLPQSSAFSQKYNAETVRWLLLFTGAALAIEFPAKAFAGIITAYEKFNVIAYLRIFFGVVTALLNYYYLKIGYGVVCMAIIGFSMSILSTFVYVYFSSRYFQALKFSRSFIRLDVLKDLYRYSKWTFLVDVFVIAKNRIDVWGVGYYLGAEAVAVYYVGLRLVDYAITFISQITGITMPALAGAHFNGDLKDFKNKTLIFLNVILYAGTVFFAGLYILGDQFIARWMGLEFDHVSAYRCMMIVLLGKLLKYIFDPVRTALFSAGHPQLIAYISGGELLLSFILMIGLAPDFGLIGVSIATAAPFLLSRAVIMPILLNKYVGVSVVKFYFSIILAVFGVLVLVLVYANISIQPDYFDVLKNAIIIFVALVAYFVFLNIKVCSDFFRLVFKRLVRRKSV